MFQKQKNTRNTNFTRVLNYSKRDSAKFGKFSRLSCFFIYITMFYTSCK